MLDVSQAEELKLAFRRNGWKNSDIKTLSEGDFLADVLKVINGTFEIMPTRYLIDSDAPPFIPKDWSIVCHKKGGIFKFEPDKISFYVSKNQEIGVYDGNDLRKELDCMQVMNASVLDYLLAHPWIIPEE